MLTHSQIVEAIGTTILNASQVRRTFVVNSGPQTLSFDFSHPYPTLEEMRLGAFNLGLAIGTKNNKTQIETVALAMPIHLAIKELSTGKIAEKDTLLVCTWNKENASGKSERTLLELIRGDEKVVTSVQPMPPPNNISVLDSGVFTAFTMGIISKQIRTQ